ncbi:uncharacterized protein UTRI_06020_B [Ustilago trichophora]|uniref:Uncharacterized protein n=1 Tax=Ustilago trichophora TaxID=86804 RepID=A0A5C3EM49_9BASI|nr:uncharacterized protein UTRI_06020_B [Ustilago trichophora]
MFADAISPSPRIPSSPWSTRLSTSASTSASTTAPPTPPSTHPFRDDLGTITSSGADKHHENRDHQLPALHLLNMSGDDAISDISDEPDGFFSLDMDVSIDQQLQDHHPNHAYQSSSSQPASQQISAIPSLSEPFDPSPQRLSRDTSASPLLNPALRRASETVPYSSSPLQRVGLDPIMASRSRNSPVFHAAHISNASNTNVDAHTASPPSAFGPIAPEVDQKGNLEYKLKILPPTRERFDRLVTQLKWRLLEGAGLAVYEIGVLDDGSLIGLDPDSMKDSLKLLSLMAAQVGANCYVQRVLALEKLPTPMADDEAHSIALPAQSRPSTSRLAEAESHLSLRALASTEAKHTLQPYILSHHIDQHTRSHWLQSGAAGLYRFDIAEQHTSIPPPLTSDTSNAAVASVAALDPTLSVTDDDAQITRSVQTNRPLLKPTNSLPSTKNLPSTAPAPAPAPTRAKKHILQGRDQSEIVYLPSKEEKRILRAAAAAAAAEAVTLSPSPSPPLPPAAAETALSHVEAEERKMMAKMTLVADTIQPKTARARARARKTSSTTTTVRLTRSVSCSPTASPAIEAVSSKAACTGYENVMSAFGVLSERAARTLGKYGSDDGVKARLIVEALVRRDFDSQDD